MRRRLIIILSYTAVKVYLRTTSLMSQPHTSHNNPRCRRDHPRSPLICKDRVMGRLLCHSIAKHLQVRLSRRINKQAHIGLPKFLSLSNILLRHNSPTEYLLNLRMSPPMSLHISRRYLHLSRPNRSNTQLRQRRRRTLPMGLHTGLLMIIERRAIHPHTRRLHKCLWAHHTRLHMMNSVPMRMEADPAAPRATVTRPGQSRWSMMCKT